MPRIPLVSPDALTDDQRRVYERIVAGPRKAIVGPLRAALHIPELADRWAQFGELMRFRTAIPARLSELAILVTARRWNSQVEWHFHAQSGQKAGISEAAIEAIRNARPPVFDTPVETLVYEFTRQLQELGDPSEETYAQVLRELGVAGVVELTAVIGYYTMVSMTLNAHDIPVPEGAEQPLQPVANQAAAGSNKFGGLTSLAPACEPTRSTVKEP